MKMIKLMFLDDVSTDWVYFQPSAKLIKEVGNFDLKTKYPVKIKIVRFCNLRVFPSDCGTVIWDLISKM